MSKLERRPKVLPDDSVRVETIVPKAVSDAISVIENMTSTTRRSVLRQLIVAGLQSFELASSEVATTLPVTTYKKEN